MAWWKLKNDKLASELEQLAGIGYAVAAADGDVSTEELETIAHMLSEVSDGDLSFAELERLLEVAHGKASEDGLIPFVRSLAEAADEGSRHHLVALACAVAMVDGTITSGERKLLSTVGDTVGLDEATIDAFIDEILATAREALARAAAVDAAADADTARIESALEGKGWIDPMATLRAAGIEVTGFGAVALQHENTTGHLLRLEHHPEDGSIHFHLTDASDTGQDFAIVYGDALDALLEALTGAQAELTLASLEPFMRQVVSLCPELYLLRDGERLRIEPPPVN